MLRVEKFLKDSIHSWVIVLSASLLFFYSFFQLNIFNSISIEVMKDFNLNAIEMGWLSSFYFIGNFVFLFPAGLLLDRFSTKRLIIIALIFAMSSMLGFCFSYNLIQASFFRFISGVAGAFSFVSCVRLASRWFSSKKLALITGLIVSIGMIGGLVAQIPMSYLTKHLGWRKMMLSCGIAGFFFIAWVSYFVHNYPKNEKIKEEKKELKKMGFGKTVFLVLSNRYNWFGGFYTALINIPIFVLGALWGKLYLMEAKKLSSVFSSYIILALFIGAIFGSPFVGEFSDFLKRRKLPMLLGSVLCLITIIIIIYIPSNNFTLYFILFLLLGFFSSAQALSYPAITELNSPLLTASATSIISSLLIASGFIFQPLFGWMLHSDAYPVASEMNFSSLSYYRAMILLPISFALSFIFAFLIKETKCKYQKLKK